MHSGLSLSACINRPAFNRHQNVVAMTNKHRETTLHSHSHLERFAISFNGQSDDNAGYENISNGLHRRIVEAYKSRRLTCCHRSGVIDVGDGLSEFALLFPGKIDEDDVRVLPNPVEDDLLAVR